MFLKALPRSKLFNDFYKSRSVAKAMMWVKITTIIPNLILDIIELIFEVENNRKLNKHNFGKKSEIELILIGTIVICINIGSTINFIYILKMYNKYGPIPVTGQRDLENKLPPVVQNNIEHQENADAGSMPNESVNTQEDEVVQPRQAQKDVMKQADLPQDPIAISNPIEFE